MLFVIEIDSHGYSAELRRIVEIVGHESGRNVYSFIEIRSFVIERFFYA